MVKKGLCVGVNYPNQEHQLYGCVNDCLEWDKVLKEHFAFEETRVLLDQYPDGSLAEAQQQLPSRANILAQLGGWLVAGAQPGDVLVFVFAGHGCQVRLPGGELEDALVPCDSAQGVVLRDELHALFARLPPGCYLTVILDCCHGAHMLDVPSSYDSSEKPFRVHQTFDKPQEVPHRTRDAWMQGYLDHAKSRPRFLPTMSVPPRQKRTPEGAGAHLGRMTLDPGVTAFCLAASRPFETARDASIKGEQCGVMTYCLIQALEDCQCRCTFQDLFEKAVWRLEDIRSKYMPMMDQTIQMSFCPNSAPSEVVVWDERYAPVAQHRLTQMMPAQPPPAQFAAGGPPPQPVRESSTEFVPSPMYNMASTGIEEPEMHIVYCQVFLCQQLQDPGSRQIDPYVRVRIGNVEHHTPVLQNTANPRWSEDENKFTFRAKDIRSDNLLIQVCNAFSRGKVIGEYAVPLHNFPLIKWQETNYPVSETGTVELRIAVYPENATRHGVHSRSASPRTARPSVPSPSPAMPSPGRSAMPSPIRPDSPDPAMMLQDNIFGKPNLFSAMPDLLSQLAKDPQLDGVRPEPRPASGFSGLGLGSGFSQSQCMSREASSGHGFSQNFGLGLGLGDTPSAPSLVPGLTPPSALTQGFTSYTPFNGFQTTPAPGAVSMAAPTPAYSTLCTTLPPEAAPAPSFTSYTPFNGFQPTPAPGAVSMAAPTPAYSTLCTTLPPEAAPAPRVVYLNANPKISPAFAAQDN